MRSSMSSSVPCRWPTTGTSGATRAAASWIGVRWCRCRTSASAAPASSRARAPRGDVGLVRVVVEGGEDAVRCVGAVLVGRVHGRVAAVEAHGVDVAALVEALGVAAAGERAGDDRHVAAVRGQLAGERPRHVRRSAAGKEHQGAEHAHPLCCTRSRYRRRERDHGRDRAPAGQHDAVVLARDVAQPPGAHERGRAPAVEVERRARAEGDERLGELGQREPGLVVGAPVAGDGEQPPVAARGRAPRAGSAPR